MGTLDFEHAVKHGQRRFEPGVLVQANRGILYVDEVNLLNDHLVDVLPDAAAAGFNVVEREGISYSHPAEFILVGTMNPEEGELRPQLLDRFGLCVQITGIDDPAERVEVVRRRAAFEEDPEAFIRRWETEQKRLRERIVEAKRLLPGVRIADEMLFHIARIAIEMGVDGHRADLVMMKSAKTMAAFEQRVEVREEDIRATVNLALLHRTRRKPFQEPGIDQPKLEVALAGGGRGHGHAHPHAHDDVRARTWIPR